MKANIADFIFLVLAVAVGAFIALIVWTLIVKNQVSAQLSASTSGGLVGLLTGSANRTAGT